MINMLLSALVLALFTSLLPSASAAFTFSTSTNSPVQCGQVNVNWQGGTPPFRMLVIPAFDYPTNISIPDSAWSDGTGSYSWTVNYPSGTDFVLLMSDSTGIGMGGVSQLFKVGDSSNSSACTLRPMDTDFFFYLNRTSVNQCDPVQVYWDDTAVAPVTILGVIPQGQPFQFESVGSATSITWNTNIAAGTQFILAAFNNGRYGIGGSSALLTVGASGSSSCLDDSSPSSTPVSNPTASETGTRTRGGGGVKTVTSITTATPKGAAGLSTGAIAGIAIAAVVVVLVIQGMIFYFCCRRQFAALLSHRRQMRDKEVKQSDVVDLVDDPENEGGDRATSLHRVRTRDTSNRLSTAAPGGRTRSSVGDAYDTESSISPYWDLAPATSTGYLPISTSRGPFDSPPEDELVPPQHSHLRNDSLTSNNSRQHLTLNLDNSPSMLSLPQFSPFNAQSSSVALAHPLPTAPVPAHITSPSRQSPHNPPQTKAQMAASLSAQNPDRNPGSSTYFGRQPPPQAPPGGFRLHEDAGRVDDEAPEMEELPPMYRPEWEAESQRPGGRRESDIEGGGRPTSPTDVTGSRRRSSGFS